MAWSAPKTDFDPGDVLTAAEMNAIGENLVAVRSPQINVVSTTLTSASNFSLATTTISAAIGLDVSITPSANTSKVLISASLTADLDSVNPLYALLYRGGSVLAAATGDASGSRRRVTASMNCSANAGETMVFQYLDSPATTSATTYSLRVQTGSGGTRTVYINSGPSDGNAATTGRSISVISAMEIPV